MENNLFKPSAKLMKEKLMAIQPLFFWILVMMFAMMPLAAKQSVDLGFIFTVAVVALCFTAFLAGWYNCVKYTVSLKNRTYETPEEHNKAQFEILKNFFPGVGEYILPVTISTLIYGILGYGVFELYRYFSMKVFFAENLPQEFIKIVNFGTQAEITQYLQNNFSDSQLKIMLLLLFGGFCVYFLFNIFVLWFAPAIFYYSKNPIKAIYHAVIFTFKNFKSSLLIVLVMFVLNLLISFTNVFLGNNFLAFIPMLLTFLYIMYYVITVFLYYESKTQNSGNNGAECIG